MFVPVTVELLKGFQETINIFILTLVFALPLGGVVALGTMSSFKPLRALIRSFV